MSALDVLSQQSLAESRNTHWIGHQSNTYSLTHFHRFRVSSQPDGHLFGLWEETGVNPHRQYVLQPSEHQQEFRAEASSRRPHAAAKTAQLGRGAAKWGETSQPLSRADTISQPVSPARQSLVSQHRANETLHSKPQRSDKLLCLLSSQHRHCRGPPPPQPWWMHFSKKEKKKQTLKHNCFHYEVQTERGSCRWGSLCFSLKVV